MKYWLGSEDSHPHFPWLSPGGIFDPGISEPATLHSFTAPVLLGMLIQHFPSFQYFVVLV